MNKPLEITNLIKENTCKHWLPTNRHFYNRPLVVSGRLLVLLYLIPWERTWCRPEVIEMGFFAKRLLTSFTTPGEDFGLGLEAQRRIGLGNILVIINLHFLCLSVGKEMPWELMFTRMWFQLQKQTLNRSWNRPPLSTFPGPRPRECWVYRLLVAAKDHIFNTWPPPAKGR